MTDFSICKDIGQIEWTVLLLDLNRIENVLDDIEYCAGIRQKVYTTKFYLNYYIILVNDENFWFLFSKF